MIVLVWVYYSAQIFFFGAEFTHVYAQEFGSLKGRETAGTGDVVTVPVEKLQPPEPQPTLSRVEESRPTPRPIPVERPSAPPAVRAMSLVVIAALGGLGWWRTRSHRHPADR